MGTLRSIAKGLSESGMKRKEIYSKFLDFFSILKDAERADDQAILGDVMDMISDSFAPDNPNNMNLPD